MAKINQENLQNLVKDIEQNLRNSLYLAAGVYSVMEDEVKNISIALRSKEELLKKGEGKSSDVEKKVSEISEKVKQQFEVLSALQKSIQEKMKELSEKTGLKNLVSLPEEELKEEIKQEV